MSRLVFVVLAACGGSDPQVTASVKFTPTETAGPSASPLDPLANQPIDMTIVLDGVGVARGGDASCTETTLFVTEAERTARGATAATVEDVIFNQLVGWEIFMSLCANPDQSLVRLESAINELNLVFGCAVVPASAQNSDAEGPVFSTFTASNCDATILDVVNNRILLASGFTMTIATGPATVP